MFPSILPRPPRAFPAAALLLAACGASPPSLPVGPIGPVGPASAPGPATAAPAFPVAGTFGTPGLPLYAATKGLAPNAAEAALRPAWSPEAAGFPALACTAREYAVRFAGDGVDPDPGTVVALSEHCGLWSPPPDVFAFTAPSLDRAMEQLQKVPPELHQRALALGAVSHPNGAVTVALAQAPTGLALDPLPRARTAGAGKLAGKRLQADGTLVLLASTGPRTVIERPLIVGPDGRFEADLTGLGETAGDGTLRLEIVRTEGLFQRSLGLLRLTDAPAPTAYPTPPTPLANPGREAQDATLLGAVNLERQSAGVPPLRPLPHAAAGVDTWLDAVAQGSAALAPAGLQDERGWSFARLRYAFSAGSTLGQAVALLLETPLGRRALLDPADTDIAFGLRPFGARPGEDVVFVPLTRFQALEAADTRATLLAGINGRRHTTGRPELTASPGLDAVAQKLAEEALSGKLAWRDVPNAAGRDLQIRQVPVEAFGAGGLTQVRFDPAAFAAEPDLQDKAMKALGLGVASGVVPGVPQPQHVIVYIVADKVPPAAK